MTEKIRKPIGKRKKLPQFTIMNVIEGQAGLENYSSLFFYSLTIDNILNIIVLLILAGVALNLTIGQNGVFQRAQDAANTWRNAEANEQLALQEGADLIDQYLNENSGGTGEGKDLKDITGNEITNTTTHDKYGNPITIPAGFKVVNPDADVTKGIVIEDVSAPGKTPYTKGSQFVWIPVGDVYTSVDHTEANKKTITLGRYTFDDTTGKEDLVQSADNWNDNSGKNIIDSYYVELANSDYGNVTPKNLPDFIRKTKTSQGYYIGRYEAGDALATERRTGQLNVSNINNPITCKKDVYPYSCINQSDSSKLCQEMYNSSNFDSDLINSYAWDTAIVFIQKFSEDKNYSRQIGKNTNVSVQKSGKSILNVVDSGDKSQDERCNIFDMAGNTYEWTTESSSNTDKSCVYRGGYFYVTDYYTSYRGSISTVYSYDVISGRPILYL